MEKEIKQKRQQIVACLLIEGNFHIQFPPSVLFILPVIVNLEHFDSN